MFALFLGCAPPPPPNLLLVTLDTTRADALGAYGQPLPVTPHLDQLAAEGARFDRAYTVTPLTIPAHSSIMTGAYPPRHGVRDNGDAFLADGVVTLAERLHDRGYATMASVGAEVTSHHWGFAQGFDAFHDQMERDPDEQNRWRVERPAAAVIDDALAWLGARPKDSPWFAWVHMYDAHHPYRPVAASALRFPDRPYLAEVSTLDTELGRVFDAVRARGEWDRTWIVVVADHGEGHGDHGEQLHGVLLYDATTRIPFLIRAPGAGPRVVDTPVSLVDVAPTLIAASGAAPLPGVDGVDLGPVLRGGAGDTKRTVYAESLYAWRHYGWSPLRALVTNDHKLLDATTPEVYARADRAERDDLAADAALLGGLQGQLGTLYAGLSPTEGARTTSLDPEQIAQLEALGYLTSVAADTTGELPRGLPDPVAKLPILAEVEDARARLQADDLEGARAALEGVLKSAPELRDTQVTLAQVLLRMGKKEEARELALRLHAEQPTSNAAILLGSMEMARGRPDLALPLFESAVQIDPYLVPGWVNYLRALLLTEDPRLVAEAERAWGLLPDSLPVAGLVGVARVEARRYEAARPLLDAAMAASPNDPFLHWAMGMCALAQTDVNSAEAAFLEEVRLFPPAPQARRELVRLYADQKRYAEQIEQLEVIRATTAPEPFTLHSLAQAQFNLQRYQDARAVVAECRSRMPDYAGCAMLEANVLDKLGDAKGARAAYEVALRLAGQEKGKSPAPP